MFLGTKESSYFKLFYSFGVIALILYCTKNVITQKPNDILPYVNDDILIDIFRIY